MPTGEASHFEKGKAHDRPHDVTQTLTSAFINTTHWGVIPVTNSSTPPMIPQNLFRRSFYTATARALQLQTRSQRLGSPLATVPVLPHRRTVASSVGSRPASQNLKHAALNIREEVGNSAADAARSIAGGNMATDYVPPEKQSSFVSLQIDNRLHVLSEQGVTYEFRSLVLPKQSPAPFPHPTSFSDLPEHSPILALPAL